MAWETNATLGDVSSLITKRRAYAFNITLD